MRSIQWDHLSPLKLNHPPKAYLPGWVPNDLRQNRGWNDDSPILLQRSIKSEKDSAVVPFQRD
jgi:hypothetical protein